MANDFNPRPVRPELVEGGTQGFSAPCYEVEDEGLEELELRDNATSAENSHR